MRTVYSLLHLLCDDGLNQFAKFYRTKPFNAVIVLWNISLLYDCRLNNVYENKVNTCCRCSSMGIVLFGWCSTSVYVERCKVGVWWMLALGASIYLFVMTKNGKCSSLNTHFCSFNLFHKLYTHKHASRWHENAAKNPKTQWWWCFCF